MIKPLTASSAYCTELKERLRESESELEAVKNELAVLQEKAGNEIAVLREELACTQSQLAESQEKLKVYAEREKLAKTESEQVSINYTPKYCQTLNFLCSLLQQTARTCQVTVT
jgi:chromosome segregation ATPase